MEPMDSELLAKLNSLNFMGMIGLVCVTVIMIQFRGLVFSVVSKVFGIAQRKKDNGKNGNGNGQRNGDNITKLQMENILLKRDNLIDEKINSVKEDLNSRITASKEELTSLITQKTGEIYAKMESNKGEVLSAIAKIGA